MPNLNGKGPQGQEAMTGRGRGRCRVNQTSQKENPKIQTTENQEIVYGIGRGSKPRGGG